MAKILLVDDEKDVREMLRDALKLRGHSVDIAASAEDALKLARDRTYDVAVVDYVLPGKKGLDLVHELRERQPFMRSIIISGQIDHDALDAAELEKQLKDRIAADRYLSKPTSIETLSQAIVDVTKPATDGDWKKMASNAMAGKKVKAKHVKDMNRVLSKARKKPGQ